MRVQPYPLDEWIAADELRPAPTFFARPAWALALQDAVAGYVAAPLRAGVDGARYVLPLVRTTGGRVPFRNYLGFPLGTYTCVLDDAMLPAPGQETIAVVEAVARIADDLQLVLWPLNAPPARHRFATRGYETAVIDCAEGYEAVIRGIRGVTRRMGDQAARRGVVCKRAGVTELEAYYRLLEAASRAWGLERPTISFELLQAVFRRAGDAAQLWLAYAGEQPVGGGVILLGASELFFWSAAMNRDYARLRPSNALNLALLRYACERGLRWYNLGANEGLEGVARFKRDLGAVPVPYRLWRHRRSHVALYDRLRTALVPARL